MSIQELKTNPEDKIVVDVPLFIRLLEFSREEAKDDQQLHFVTDRLLKLHQQGIETLTMDDYAKVVPVSVEEGSPYNVVLDGAKYYLTRASSLKDYLNSLAGYIKSDEPELAQAFLAAIKKLG